MASKDRVYNVDHDKWLADIGVQINPHGKPKKMRWLLELISLPEIMPISIVIFAIIVYFVARLFL